jgi:hypothetical protein
MIDPLQPNLHCKICGEKFETERSLHSHFKKHKLTVAEYYCQQYPRINKLTGDPLPFKNKFDYFTKDFTTALQMKKWIAKSPDDEVKEYILNQLRFRIQNKNLRYAPSHLELETLQLPSIEMYIKYCGSYSNACKLIEVEPIFKRGLASPEQFFEYNKKFDHVCIYVDTREQNPLSFENSEYMKLDFGDYTTGGEEYTYTYVDRKSENDLKGTLSKGLERFKRELERAREFDSYLYIVVETSISKLKKNNLFGPHKSNLEYIFHNIRHLTHEYSDVCQFIFSGNRTCSEIIIPKLLLAGKKLWNVDFQYYIDKYGIGG